MTPTWTDYAEPGSRKTLQLPTHLLPHSINPNNAATFEGACIDMGAPRSVVGLLQAEAYARYLNIQLALGKACPVRFRFGQQLFSSLGSFMVRVPMHRLFVSHRLEVVDVNVPMLLGMD